MSLEAVEYVKQAEERVEELRKNKEEKTKAIHLEAKDTIQQKQEQSKKTLAEYRSAREKEYQSKLSRDQENSNQELSREIKQLKETVNKNEETVVNDIVKVVVKRYGNS